MSALITAPRTYTHSQATVVRTASFNDDSILLIDSFPPDADGKGATLLRGTARKVFDETFFQPYGQTDTLCTLEQSKTQSRMKLTLVPTLKHEWKLTYQQHFTYIATTSSCTAKNSVRERKLT